MAPQLPVSAFFHAAVSLVCLSGYTRLWILQLQLSLGLTALVHSIWQFKEQGENYRSQHMGTGRMWLLETMQPGDRRQKKVLWILQACHVVSKLDLLFFTEVPWAWGFSIKSQVCKLFLKHSRFWVTDHSRMCDANREHFCQVVARAGWEGCVCDWSTSVAAAFSLPLKESCGLAEVAARDQRGMPNSWWGSSW